MGLYSVAGLSAKIELPVPLVVDLIPASQTNQRPGIKLTKPLFWVQHETANEAAGADAAMHNRWLHGGASGGQVSFHFCVDDHQIYQMIPVDEVTWQAADGGGPGNMSGVSCELCVNRDGDEAKARRNAEALAGAVCRALGIPTANVKRHWDFNYANGPESRHHCPDHMMSEGYWPTFVANVGKIIVNGTTTPAPPSPYVTPKLPSWWSAEALASGQDQVTDGTRWYAIAREFEAVSAAPCKAWADPKAPDVREPLQVREKVRAAYWLTAASDGKPWIVTQYGTRIPADKLTPKVTLRTR